MMNIDSLRKAVVAALQGFGLSEFKKTTLFKKGRN
jgi:hypothetical protein